jgi:cytochrome c oxidase assembly protein subunit 11
VGLHVTIVVAGFCFDEQRLKPHETVEMPVLFYLDPDILKDKNVRDIDNVVLSYTFFLVNEGELAARQTC